MKRTQSAEGGRKASRSRVWTYVVITGAVLSISLFFFGLTLFTWGFGVLILHRLFDNLILFEAECSVFSLMIGMLADLINVRLRR